MRGSAVGWRAQGGQHDVDGTAPGELSWMPEMADSARKAVDEFARRSRQARVTVRRDGVRGLAATALSGMARRIAPSSVVPSVRDQDVLGADLSRPFSPPILPRQASDPLTINWVMPPPGENSGGHTTAFRIIRYLQGKGHTSRVYFYDAYGADLKYYSDLLVRNYADVEVGDVFGGMKDADAVFATCWESAYAVYNARSPGKRFYLVQDFEPSFYPAGATAALAENTYRMGFHAITAGPWLSNLLQRRYGMEADYFDFGCDNEVYGLGSSVRSGVVFYCRPRAPRRAFELGVLALDLFHRAHPDIEIHAYGDSMARSGVRRFPVTDHGLVSPSRLNEIYNACYAGLSLSMTNVSLVPYEMLAAGCIPVVNDAEHNRLVLANDHVHYVPADPHALARALGDVVTDADFAERASRAALSVNARTWEDAGAAVESALLRALT